MRYVVIVDTPGIKQFVFGTDAAAEIRGASALLVRLNQHETEPRFRERLECAGGRIERTVYANGGTAQFLVEVPDRDVLRDALADLARHYRAETGGEVRLAFGYAQYDSSTPYGRALRAAFDQLRARREMSHGRRTVELLPFMKECESTSHLPAQVVVSWGGERLLLARASKEKRAEVREATRSTRRHDLWSQWMRHLHDQLDWPDEERWDTLRHRDFNELGERSRQGGSLGLVYADGNAMGRLVQELDSPDVAEAFSTIVDDSIRTSCFEALDGVCTGAIDAVRRRWRNGQEPLGKLPADILLLGGDDLLVLLPADRALRFSGDVARRFEARTRTAISSLAEGPVRTFFTERIQSKGLTISCGVAIARASYPFVLLLELAESLLKSAKKGGTAASTDGYWAPSYVDFHQVAGPSSFDLAQVRELDYLTQTPYPRTIRPLPIEELGVFKEQIDRLRRARFPRSKLHDLFEASLDHSPTRATRGVRELFSRCKQDARRPQRLALWEAVVALSRGSPLNFPWAESTSNRMLAIADLVEAYDLFPEESDA